MKHKSLIKELSKSGKAVILFLVFFYPFGVYLMWKGEQFNPDMRWFISSLFIIVTLIFGKITAS